MGINRGTVLDLINDVHRAGGFKDYNSYSYLFDQVDTMPESKEDAEPHWIPCGEELPKEEGFYLVTIEFKHGAETNIRYFKIENCERYWSKWGNENITAWMPKPIPYQQKNEVTE